MISQAEPQPALKIVGHLLRLIQAKEVLQKIYVELVALVTYPPGLRRWYRYTFFFLMTWLIGVLVGMNGGMPHDESGPGRRGLLNLLATDPLTTPGIFPRPEAFLVTWCDLTSFAD